MTPLRFVTVDPVKFLTPFSTNHKKTAAPQHGAAALKSEQIREVSR